MRRHFVLLLIIKLVSCFEIDDSSPSSTEEGDRQTAPFVFNNGQVGRSNQTDDILSNIYSTVASVSKDLNERVTFNNSFSDAVSSPGIISVRKENGQICRGALNDEEFTVRPSHRVCDYLVSRNHSGICSLDLSLVGWNGDCRDSWLEAGGKHECGPLTGTRRLNFDRSAISLRMSSAEGILLGKQIPCSNQITPPSTFIDNLTLPLSVRPEHQRYPEPYIPPNLRPNIHDPNLNHNFPVGPYLPPTQSGSNNLAQTNPDDLVSKINTIVTDQFVAINPSQQPNSKYPSHPQQNHKDPSISSIYRPNYPPTIYPGMRYGPPECDKSSGVVISSPGYPNLSPPSECFLVIYPNGRLCSPLIYFDYFEVGNSFDSPCRNFRVDIGDHPFCGCLTGMSWQVPNNVFSQDGSLSLRFRGQGRFLVTVYYNTCQQGSPAYPPNQRQPWRCNQSPPPQPYPIPPSPRPPTIPYPIYPSPSQPAPPPLRPVPRPPRPCPPSVCRPQPQPYPYPPKQPPPQPPFPYPPPQPLPQPPIPYPTPSPQPAPQPYPEPYPPCQVIRVPQGSINCAPIQPQFYCYRFEPPADYCQMYVMFEQVKMTPNGNCDQEYMTTGLRNPRICEKNVQNVPMYIERGESLHGKLMPGSSIRASFQGLPCSCNVEYRQSEFTIRATPPHELCQYTIHRVNQGICSIEFTFDNVELECGIEALIIDGKTYCGQRQNEKLEIDFLDPQVVVKYQRSGQVQNPGSFSIRVLQKARCFQTLPTPTGRDIKYREECILPLSGIYGNIEFPGNKDNSYQFLACSYVFQPRQDYCYVRLDFDNVDLPNTLDCSRYYININDIKYCGNTLSTSTKVLEIDDERGGKISYKVDRTSRWRFSYLLLPCKPEILARSQQAHNHKYSQRSSWY